MLTFEMTLVFWYEWQPLVKWHIAYVILAGIHVFKAFPAYTTTELWVRTKCSSICSVSGELYL